MEENVKMTDEELDSVSGGTPDSAFDFVKNIVSIDPNFAKTGVTDRQIDDAIESYRRGNANAIRSLIGTLNMKAFKEILHSY